MLSKKFIKQIKIGTKIWLVDTNKTFKVYPVFVKGTISEVSEGVRPSRFLRGIQYELDGKLHGDFTFAGSYHVFSSKKEAVKFWKSNVGLDKMRSDIKYCEYQAERETKNAKWSLEHAEELQATLDAIITYKS